MSENTPENANETNEALNLSECRACLQKIDGASDLFDLFQAWAPPWDGMGNTIAEDLTKLSQIKISIIDEHSKFICRICYQRLQDACNFVSIVQSTDMYLRQRCKEINGTSEKVWPKPIQVDKNIDTSVFESAMEIEIKQEVISDEEYSVHQNEDDCKEEVPQLDIKVEPEEIVEPQTIQIVVNGTISKEQFDQHPPLVNGNANYEHEEYLDSAVKEEPMSEEDSEAVPDLSLECMLCTKSFNSVTGLKAHVIAQHSYKTVRRKTDNNPSPQKKYSDKFVCATCRRIFVTPTDLMVHETCHNKHVCYGCNAKFDSFEQLSSHRKRCKAKHNKSVQKPKTLEDVKRSQLDDVKIESSIEDTGPNSPEYITPNCIHSNTSTDSSNDMEIHLEIHSINRAQNEEMKVEEVESVLADDTVAP